MQQMLLFNKRYRCSLFVLNALFIIVLSSYNSQAQTPSTVVIGPTSGTSNYFYGPIVRASSGSILNYSRHAYLYTAAELGIPSGAKIIKLEWLKSNTATITANNTFQMWIGNSTATSIASSTTWGTLLTGTTKVYSSSTFAISGGTATYQGGQFNITGSDTFTYTGGNLQIMTDWFKGGTASGAVNFFITAAAGKAVGTTSNVALTDASVLTAANYGDNRPCIRITYIPVPPCSGPPYTGGIISAISSACAGVPFTLNIANTLSGSGISYLWQSADNAAFTLNVTNLGTGASQTSSQTSAKYYRCIATCSSGPSADTSAPFYMPMSPGYACACSSAPASAADEDIFNVMIAATSNSSDCNTIPTGPGSIPQVYSNYQGLTPATVQRGSTVPFSISIGTCLNNYPNVSAIFVDFNQNGSYSDAGEQVYGSTSTPITGPHTESGNFVIPTNATLGVTGLRVITSEQNTAITNPCLQYSWGETEDYTINIVAASACSGMPSPGNTIASQTTICTGKTTVLSLQNWILGSGVSYQWYNSAGAISGATTFSYTTPSLTNAESYYCRVTCSGSGLSANSTPVIITMSPFTDCYCSSVAGNAADDNISQVTLNGATNVSNCTNTAPGPGSILHRYANYFPLGNLTNLQQGSTVPFSVLVDDCDFAPYYSFGTAIWIDFNHNGVFTDAGEQVFVEAVSQNAPRTVSGNISIPCGAMLGQTAMRIIEASGYAGSLLTPCLSYGSGETEDYLINIIPQTGSIGFNFGTSGSPTGNATSGVPVSNLSISSITQGNNVNTSQTTLLINAISPSTYSGASTNNNIGITARNRNLQINDSSAYFAFTLTPSSGYQVILDSIFLGSLSTSTGPTSIDIRTSKDNYASSVGITSVSANGSWAYITPALSPVVSSTPLSIRIYGYVSGGNGSVTTGNNTVNWRVDDINIKCTIKCTSPCNAALNCTQNNPLCFGGIGSITANAINTTGIVYYAINGGTPQLSNTFTNLTAGNYTVVATDANACSRSSVVILVQPTKATSYTTQTACNTYTWSVNNQTYTNTGVYTATGLTANGCVRYDTLSLTINYNTILQTQNVTACNSYTWYGTSYTASGTYVGTSSNANGCTQTQTVNLSIIPSTTSTSTSACGSHIWTLNGITYTTSGTYSYVNGCQTNTLILSIVPFTSNTTTTSACASYTWSLNGQTYTASGTYTYVSGCQTNTLNLTIVPNTTSSTTASACGSYTWSLNGQTYTTSGTYTFVNVCQTNTLNLTIVTNTTSSTTASACGSYTWVTNGQTYTTSGTYTFVNVCQTNTLQLTIVPNSTSSTTASGCGSYTWSLNNQTYTASGTYTFVNGCQTNTLNLTIVPNTTSNTTISACGSYTWVANGQTYTASGTYTYVNVCQTNTLTLTIVPNTTASTTASACGSYTWADNGTTYTNSGSYSFVSNCITHILTLSITPGGSNTQTVSACDSYAWTVNNNSYTQSGTYFFNQNCIVYTLNLSITPSFGTKQNIQSCDQYLWIKNNQTYTATGTYYYQTGCEKDTLLLTITPSSTVSQSVTACDTYTWAQNNQTYTATGNYSVVIGCQTQILQLTINDSTTATVTQTACDSYLWPANGQTYTTSGSYIHTSLNASGCLYTQTLPLSIHLSSNHNQTVSSCNSYTWTNSGLTYTQSGTYAATSINAAGCLHTEVLLLSIGYSSSSTQNQSACSSYTWSLSGLSYTTSGLYTKTSLNASGCVHTSNLQLSIGQPSNSSNSQTACDAYLWSVNGQTYTASGTYTSTAINASGCVHTNTLLLTIIPSSSNTNTVQSCNQYTWNVNSVTYTQSGTYTYINGCQTNTLVLSITSSSTSSQTISACGSYTWNENNITYTASGTYTAVNGCMTHMLNLSVTPNTSNNQIVSACGSYPWNTNNTTYTSSGTYTAIVGCQTNTINLTITPITSSNTTNSACGSYTWNANNQTYTSSGTYTHTNGCHTDILNLTLVPNTISTLTVSACGSYTWSANNTTYTQSGTYTSIQNCATYILQLTMTGTPTQHDTVYAVDTYTWARNNTTYTTSGVYTFSLNTGASCDSVYVLTLSIIGMDIYVDQPISCLGINDGSIQVTALAAGNWLYSVDGSPFTNTSGLFSGLASGLHTFCAKNGSAIYCDTFSLSSPDALMATMSLDSVVSCHGNDGALSLTVTGGTNVLQGYITVWTNSNGDTLNSPNTNNFALYLQDLPADTYHVVVEDDNGCFTSAMGTVTTAPPISLQAIYNPILCTGGTTPLTLQASGGVPYDSLTLLVNGQPPLAAYPVGTYTVSAIDTKGCSATTLVSISSCSSPLTLTFFIQGYYVGAGIMQPALLNQGETTNTTVCDSVDISLYESTAPYALAGTWRTVLQTNGYCSIHPGPFNGNYYIGIKHRNAVHTWSAVPVYLGNGPASYDFSTAANKAYGDNQKQMADGPWALFSGDINQDENIDLLDNGDLDQGISNFYFGYVPSDVNGDGNVDLLDMPTLEENITDFIYSIHP